MSIGVLLTITFALLKLFHLISWSWWWVLAPLWISVVIFVTVVLIALAVAIFWPSYRSARRFELADKEPR